MKYVNSIDELVDLIDREFSGPDAVCPICRRRIGTVDIPNAEIGIPELKFTQFRQAGVYCTEGHPVIIMEDESKEDKSSGTVISGTRRIQIEDLGMKVYEAMKLIKPYLDIDKSMPNAQLYWMITNRQNPVCTKELPADNSLDLLDKLQRLGARAYLI